MTSLGWLLLATIAIPWLGALVVWRVGDKNPGAQHTVAVGFSLLSGVAAIALLPSAASAVVVRLPMGSLFGDFTLVGDGLGVFLAVIATVVGSLAVIFSVDYMRGEAQLGRYYALVLVFIGAMVGLVLTGSLLFMFLFWEITAFCSYALIAFHNDDPKAVAGGIKALLITSLGGVGLFMGALFIYGQLGSYDISTFIEKAPTFAPAGLACVAFGFLAAAAAKSAQFPFQTWLPDAMEAPTPISALIHAATMVNAGVYLLARFYPAFEAVPSWKTAVVVVGLLSALMAACMALVSTDLKRVLAYSTVSQLGYMVYAIGVGGVFASQFHLFSHAIFKALLFLGAGAVIHSVGTRDMRQMGGLGKQMPFTRAVFLLGALALAGLPILNGFWSKELVLEAGLKGPIWAYGGMLIGTGLTALYTFRMVWLVFFGEPREPLQGHDAQTAMKVSLGLLAAGALVSWLAAGPFGALLKSTLPLHAIDALPTLQLVMEIVTAPPTWLALGVIAIGLAVWWWREPLKGLAQALQGLGQVAADSFGFEWINRTVVAVTENSAEALRATQTGLLNWNLVGIVAGLIIILAIVLVGA
jgi:NADH-quinone oxidoreductase subunit L